MKGPRSRHKFYIVRVWECPVCKKRASVPVQVVNRLCRCQGPASSTWMSLIEEPHILAKKPDL